jgi:nitrogen fixation protein NifX
MTAIRRLRIIDPDDVVPAETGRGGAIRVAIASDDLKNLDAHFGAARRFAIFDVTAAGWTLAETVAFDNVSDGKGAHAEDGDDRITAKIEALRGCQLLFCLAIGGPPAAKAVAAKIHPIKLPAVQPIDMVLERTRAMLAGAPPPWLRKVIEGAGAGAGSEKPSFVDDE